MVARNCQKIPEIKLWAGTSQEMDAKNSKAITKKWKEFGSTRTLPISGSLSKLVGRSMSKLVREAT